MRWGLSVKRVHLYEITDQRWCPQSVRAVLTDFIKFGVNKWKEDAAMATLVRRGLEHTGGHTVIDLCSGSGGPWSGVLRSLDDEGFSVKVCLTDKYPDVQAPAYANSVSGGSVHYCSEPVDAAHVPETLAGFRTMFSAFHHFRPAEARAILQDAANRRQGIAIFEVTQRTPWALFNFLLTSLLVPFCVPFFRPCRWLSLVWTYLLPVGWAVVLFDSLVSCLRTYSVTELQEMAKGINATNYAWEAGELKVANSPVPVTYLLGYPERS
jgi:hypothetical protein